MLFSSALYRTIQVFDFTLTEKHLPATSKASFTLLNPADLIDREYRKAISSATRVVVEYEFKGYLFEIKINAQLH